MQVRNCVLALTLLASVVPTGATAQEIAPIPVETVLRAGRFPVWGRIQISPDRTMLAFAVQDPRRVVTVSQQEVFTRTGVYLGALGSDIAIADMNGGEARILTGRKGTNWEPTWSPDGKFLAFFSDREGDGQANLWLWEAATGTIRRVSNIPLRASRIHWLPDSRRLLVTVMPEGMTPDQYVARVESPQLQTVEEPKVTGATVRLYRSSGPANGATASVSGSNLNWALRDLAMIDIANGPIRRIDSGHRIHGYLLSPDGSTVMVSSGTRFAGAASQQVLFDVKTVRLPTGEERALLRDTQIGFFGLAISWSPDSSRLAYWLSSPGNENDGDYYILDADGRTPPRDVMKFARPLSFHSMAAPLWDSESRRIYFTYDNALWMASAEQGGGKELARIAGHTPVELVAQNGNQIWSPNGGRSVVVFTSELDTKKNGFYRIDLNSGEPTKLLEDNRCFACVPADPYVVVSQNGQQAVYFVSDAEHPSDIWVADADFKNPRQLTHLNPEIEKYRMGAMRVIDWLSLDGERLHGALLLPAGYETGKKYPLIVSVYGGERLSNQTVTFGGTVPGLQINPQLLTTRGYAVLLPDAPLHVGMPMVDLAKTVLPGVDKVVEMGIADPDRLGLMGHSYGGYSTLSLIVQTKRFKAAAMIDGYGDLIAHYGEFAKNGAAYGASVNEEGQGLMGGSPWQYRERYIENSPIFYLDRVETPLLIVHGSEDIGVASFLADEVFVGLRRLGKETEYAKYQGEGHVPTSWSYANYLDFCKRLIEMFDSHLKNVIPN